MAGRFSVEAVFRTVDRVTAPITRMQNRVGKFTRSAGRGFRKLNRQVDKFSRNLRSGALAIAGSLLIVGTALGSVIGTGANFEQAITNVGAVALKTRAEIAPLENMALESCVLHSLPADFCMLLKLTCFTEKVSLSMLLFGIKL